MFLLTWESGVDERVASNTDDPVPGQVEEVERLVEEQTPALQDPEKILGEVEHLQGREVAERVHAELGDEVALQVDLAQLGADAVEGPVRHVREAVVVEAEHFQVAEPVFVII